MEKIKLFLASSQDLKIDREKFEIFIGRKNKKLLDKNYFLELVIWEDFLDAMSQTRLQDEYNKAICESDIFIMLYSTKVGRYTAEEFETAFGQFKKTNKPLIYTYFKDDSIPLSKINQNDILSLFKFQKKLNQLGHFQTYYTNVEDLQLQFNNQLDLFLEQFFNSNDSEESALANELVVFLEDKRVLANLYAIEYPKSVIDSIQNIRKKVNFLLGKVKPKSPLGKALLEIRKSCKKFLDYVQLIGWEQTESKLSIQGGVENMLNLYAKGFFSALGILREEIGNELFNLTKSYNISIGEELSPILPDPKATNVELTGYLIIFEHGYDPKFNLNVPSYTYLLVQPIELEKLPFGKWPKFWFIEDKNEIIQKVEKWQSLNDKKVTITGQLFDDTERISITSISLADITSENKSDDYPDELKFPLLRLKSLDNLNRY